MPIVALKVLYNGIQCPCKVSLCSSSTLDTPVRRSSSIDRGDSMLLAGARNNARNPAVFHLPLSATPTPVPQLPPLLSLSYPHSCPLTGPTCFFFLYQYNTAFMKFVKATVVHLAKQCYLLKHAC